MLKLFQLLTVLLLSLSTLAQQRTITGTVTDNDNAPIIGASIIIKGSNMGTQTDASGNFTISIPDGSSVLLVSYVGLATQEIPVAGQNHITVSLKPAGGANLNEVVVTGYQTQRKIDLTGAVSVVNVADVAAQPKSSLLQSLQGRVAGLHVESSGDPSGRTRSLLIRGVNTLGNTNPLYIIDGIPTKDANQFAYLDPNTIESIQVLKDATSASIYGSRASNGVVIVTTKRGKGKLSVNFNSSLTVQNFARRMEVTNTEEYGRALWQASVNDGTSPDAMSARYTYDWHTDPNGVAVLDQVHSVEFVGGDSLLKATNTDWQDAVFRRGLISDNSVTISGSTEKSSLFIGLGYVSNQSVIKYNWFKRANAQINSSTSFFQGKIKFGEDFRIITTTECPLEGDHNGMGIANFNSTTVINNAYFMQTRLPVYNSKGDFSGPTGTGFSDRNNPLHIAYMHRHNRVNDLLLYGNLYLEIQPIKNLLLRSRLGSDNDFSTKLSLEPTYVEGFLSNNIAYMERLKGNKFNWTWSNTANYTVEVQKNIFDILVGTEAITNDYQEMLGHKEGFASNDPDYFQFSSGTGIATISGTRTGNQLLSYFGKINYRFSDKYLASATLRADGSSRFGVNNRFGYFPAFSVGWRINKEAFMSNVKFISNLKLRGGYGIVGNQEIGDQARFGIYQTNYGTLSGNRVTGTAYDIGGVNTGNLLSGYVATQLANDNLKWESTADLSVGLDFGFLGEKISGSVDYFNHKTKDILTRPPYAAAMGEGSSQFVNGATMANKGFEIALSYRDHLGPVSLNVSGSLSSFHDKITYLPETVVKSYPGNVEQTIIGHSVTSVFGYKTDGIFQNEHEVDNGVTQPGKGIGRLRWVDMNGDGVINTLDQTWLGTTLPDFEYGINIQLSYQNFTLAIFGAGVSGVTVNDGTIGSTDFANGQGMNFGKRVLDAWTPQNTGSNIPMLSLVNTNQETRASNYLLRNGSYFKVRNATIGYTLPSKITKQLGIGVCRIYIMGDNFLLLRPHGKNAFTGQDPETPGSIYPMPVSYTFGINLTL
jgi:TonB-linked SusC/RagA family outer membrane protein